MIGTLSQCVYHFYDIIYIHVNMRSMGKLTQGRLDAAASDMQSPNPKQTIEEANLQNKHYTLISVSSSG